MKGLEHECGGIPIRIGRVKAATDTQLVCPHITVFHVSPWSWVWLVGRVASCVVCACVSVLIPSLLFQAMSVAVTMGCVMATVPMQLYSAMDHLLTTAGLFWLYAAVAGISVVFTVLCVPETARKVVG